MTSILFAGWEVVEDQTRLLSPDGSETLRMYRDIDNDNVYIDWTFGDLIMQGGDVTIVGAAAVITEVAVSGALQVPAGAQVLDNPGFDNWVEEGLFYQFTVPDWSLLEVPTETNYITFFSTGTGIKLTSDTGLNLSQNTLTSGKEYLLAIDVFNVSGFGFDIENGGVPIFQNVAIGFSSTFISTGTDITISTAWPSVVEIESFTIYELTDGPIDNYIANGTEGGKTKYTSVNTHADGLGGAAQAWDLWWNSTDWIISLTAGSLGTNYWTRTDPSLLGVYTSSGNTLGSATAVVEGTLTVDQIIVPGLDASTGVYTDSVRQLTSVAPSTGILGYWTRADTTLSMVNAADLLSLGGDVTAVGTITGGTFTDGTMSLTGGDITSMGNITGTDVDISAGTGDYASSGDIIGIGSILFDLTPTQTPTEGLLYWNADDGTLNLGMPGGTVNGQLLQEFLKRVTNGTGSTILDGTPVYVSGESGNNLTIAPADASFAAGIAFRTYAVATEDILAGQKGFVTKRGVVRGMNLSSFAGGVALYLAVGGSGPVVNFYTTTPPTEPDITVLIGVVEKATADGELDVNIISIPNLNSLSDVSAIGRSDSDILAWNNGGNTWDSKTPTVDIPIVLTEYDPEPARSSESNVHGAFVLLDDTESVSNGVPFVATAKGIGKVIIAVIAGTDVIGDITITGTSVNRDTGATTGSDTSVITLTGVTTDASTTDSNGNTVHDFNKAYITDKWFVGVVTITTADTNISDMDLYHISFEQFNDQPSITLNTFDVNLLTTSVNAEFDAYLFDIHVTGDECDIANHGSLHIGADGETALANKYWRLRQGNINQAIDGTTDGIWVDIHYSNSPAFVEDVTMKIWATQSQPLTLN